MEKRTIFKCVLLFMQDADNKIVNPHPMMEILIDPLCFYFYFQLKSINKKINPTINNRDHSFKKMNRGN